VNITAIYAFDPDADENGAWVATIQLRSERQGGGDGRCYMIDITATDSAGNPATSSCCLVVPHDQGG
jgi:hypothetical protein